MLITTFLFYNRREKNFEARLKKNFHVYENKISTIKKALYSIDSYLSWIDFDNFRIPMREKITDLDLTLMVRCNYNALAICCNDVELINSYLRIFFHEKVDDALEEYSSFRNLCRNELELIDQLQFDKDKIFHSVISTAALTEQSKVTKNAPL